MKGVFARAWDHKSVCFFVGSVILMHAFGGRARRVEAMVVPEIIRALRRMATSQL